MPASAKDRRRVMVTVPFGLWSNCKAQAALQGITLNEYVLQALVQKLEDDIDIREGMASLQDEEGTITLDEFRAGFAESQNTVRG